MMAGLLHRITTTPTGSCKNWSGSVAGRVQSAGTCSKCVNVSIQCGSGSIGNVRSGPEF